MSTSLLFYAVVLATMLAGSHALLRYAATQGPSVLSWPRAGYTVAALSIYVVIFVWYASLLERMPLSRLYPVYTGLSVALVYMAGVALFDESWSARGVVGMVLLVAGVVLVGEARVPEP